MNHRGCRDDTSQTQLQRAQGQGPAALGTLPPRHCQQAEDLEIHGLRHRRQPGALRRGPRHSRHEEPRRLRGPQS